MCSYPGRPTGTVRTVAARWRRPPRAARRRSATSWASAQAVAWTIGGVTLRLGGLAITSSIMKMTLWSEIDEGEAAFESAASVDVMLSLIAALAFLATAVLTIIWSFRARKNVDLIDAEPMRIGPGWAIAGWLVPLVNFVVPGLLLRGIARRSTPGPGMLWVITGWWVTFVSGVIANRSVNVRLDRLELDVSRGLTDLDTLFERLDTLLTGIIGGHLGGGLATHPANNRPAIVLA